MVDYYNTEQEIDVVVAGFEQCTTAADDFKHREHLTIAVYYLRNSTEEQAFEKMRDGLLSFLDHHGVGRAKYKERLTRSWIELIQKVIEQTNPDGSLVKITNVVLERLGNSRIAVEDEDETL